MKFIALFSILMFIGIVPLSAETKNKQLNDLVESYFEEMLKLNPFLATEIGDPRYNDRFPNFIGPEERKKREDLEKTYLKKIKTLDVSGLNAQDQLTYEIFKQGREIGRRRLSISRSPASC